MLSKLRKWYIFRWRAYSNVYAVLVLGMCFFAGGLRFAEQGFDASETPPSVKDFANCYGCPSSSRNANSFLPFEHQRRGCSHACGVPFLTELADRHRAN